MAQPGKYYRNRMPRNVVGAAKKAGGWNKIIQKAILAIEDASEHHEVAENIAALSFNSLFSSPAKILTQSILGDLSSDEGNMYSVTIVISAGGTTLDIEVNIEPDNLVENDGDVAEDGLLEFLQDHPEAYAGIIKVHERVRMDPSKAHMSNTELTALKLRAFTKLLEVNGKRNLAHTTDKATREAIDRYNRDVQGADARLDDGYQKQRSKEEGTEGWRYA